MHTPISTAARPTALSRQRIAELRVQCSQDPNSVTLHKSAVGEFLNAGLTHEALPLLRRLANLCPDDATTLEQLASVLSAQGDDHEALALYRRIATLSPESAVAQHNLGVAAIKLGEHAAAQTAFEAKLALHPDDFQTMNDLGLLYAMAGQNEQAAQAYERCLSINPRYDKAQQNALQFYYDTQQRDAGASLVQRLLETVGPDPELHVWRDRFAGAPPEPGERSISRSSTTPRVTNRKIAFVAASDTFLKPIIARFAAHNDVRVVAPSSPAQLTDIMNWADLVWFEWCDSYMIDASQRPRRAKIVCRLHSYEAFTDAPAKVNWGNVDRLVLVNRSVGEILDQFWKVPARRAIIPNGIDPGRFPFVPPSQRVHTGKRLASVGYINYKKNPSLLLQLATTLHDSNPDWQLHIAGTHQDPRIKVYMDHLLPQLNLPVIWHGWIESMPDFYPKMDYVVSTSLFESFHYSIAEGMLSGCLPLVHRWMGADNVYPADCLFATPEQALAIVERYQHSDRDQVAADYRHFIVDRYNWDDRLRDIDQLLYEVLNGEATPTPSDARECIAVAPPKSEADFGLVSLIIPAHNSAATIARAVESALAQTYRHIEVLVSDDGSTDGTDQQLRPYADRITFIRQVHRGMAACLNRAIQECHGEYVCLLAASDCLPPEHVLTQVSRMAEDQSLRLGGGEASSALLSRIMFHRDVLNLAGWFDETAPAGDAGRQCLQSMWDRIECGGAITIRERTVDTPKSSTPRVSANIVFVGATDPHGQMVMWAEALNRHTQCHARVLTHTASRGYQSDLVLKRDPGSHTTDAEPRSLLQVMREAAAAIAEADLIVFAAGLAPGAMRRDQHLADTDEQPFGTIHWPDVLAGKGVASILFGTPSVRANLRWYRDHLAGKRMPVLTCEPDLHQWLPDSVYLPRLISGDLPSTRAQSRGDGKVGVIQTGALEDHDGGSIIRRAAERLKREYPQTAFGSTAGMSRTEVLAMKVQAQIGIDRIAVGTGDFSPESIENSALGLVNAVYCSPYTRALLARTLGTDQLPWEIVAAESELVSTLGSYMRNPDKIARRRQETQEWYDRYWNEGALSTQLAEIFCGL